jgi:hypothetical protein
LWLAGILALVGILQLTAQLPGMLDLSGSWPLVLVLAGLVVIVASSRRRQRSV